MQERVGDGDRGQIILISALLLAVLFVGLAVVVNSAVYAENRGTRDVTTSSEALADHPVTQERLSRTIHDVNFENDTAGYDERYRRVGKNVTDWDARMQGKGAEDGTLFGAEVAATRNGTRISQDVRGDFMPAKSSLLDEVSTLLLSFRIDPLGLGDKKNWLIANESRVRGLEMNVTRDELAERDSGLVSSLVTVADGTLTGSIVFWLESDVDDTDGDFWRLYLLKEGNNVTAIPVEFEGWTGTIQGECSARGATVEVVPSEGKLVGDDGPVPCPETRNLVGDEPRDLHFAGADEVDGTYQFIVDKEEPTFRSDLEQIYGSILDGVVDALADLLLALIGGNLEDNDIFHESPLDGHPYTTTAIWNTTVELTYRDDRVHYSRNISVPAESGS